MVTLFRQNEIFLTPMAIFYVQWQNAELLVVRSVTTKELSIYQWGWGRYTIEHLLALVEQYCIVQSVCFILQPFQFGLLVLFFISSSTHQYLWEMMRYHMRFELKLCHNSESRETQVRKKRIFGVALFKYCTDREQIFILTLLDNRLVKTPYTIT